MIHTGSSRNFSTTIGANHPALNLVKWRTPGYLTSPPQNGEHRDTIVHKTTKLHPGDQRRENRCARPRYPVTTTSKVEASVPILWENKAWTVATDDRTVPLDIQRQNPHTPPTRVLRTRTVPRGNPCTHDDETTDRSMPLALHLVEGGLGNNVLERVVEVRRELFLRQLARGQHEGLRLGFARRRCWCWECGCLPAALP